jgi:hypothetical protein
MAVAAIVKVLPAPTAWARSVLPEVMGIFLVGPELDCLIHAGQGEVGTVEPAEPQIVVGVVVEPHEALRAVGVCEDPGAEPLLDLFLAGREGWPACGEWSESPRCPRRCWKHARSHGSRTRSTVNRWTCGLLQMERCSNPPIGTAWPRNKSTLQPEEPPFLLENPGGACYTGTGGFSISPSRERSCRGRVALGLAGTVCRLPFGPGFSPHRRNP